MVFYYWRAPEDGVLPLNMRHYTLANDRILECGKSYKWSVEVPTFLEILMYIYEIGIFDFCAAINVFALWIFIKKK